MDRGWLSQTRLGLAAAFHAYGPPQNPAKSCPKWFLIISAGVATFTDTIVRLHYDTKHGYGVGFYSDRAATLFAQWLVGYLESSVWAVLNHARKDHPEWSRIEAEDFRKVSTASPIKCQSAVACRSDSRRSSRTDGYYEERGITA